jgi:predicted nucleic acid-binding protein
MNQTQSIALDSCVVIDIMEKSKVASGLKARLRGKSVKIILCDVVLDEVKRVRGYFPEKVISRISSLLGRKIELSEINPSDVTSAKAITEQFQICHNGDNKILSLCQAKNFVLVTFDRMLLKASEFVGVAAFHPSMVGGI